VAEINAAEQVWLNPREQYLSHQPLDNYDTIFDDSCNASKRNHRRECPNPMQLPHIRRVGV